MKYTMKEVMESLEKYAPLHLAESWDHCGFLLGSAKREIRRVLVALDVNIASVRQAIESSCDLLLTHHPIFFNAVRRIDEEETEGFLLTELIRHKINVYAAHTNLDAALGGVNDALAQVLGLSPTYTLIEIDGTDRPIPESIKESGQIRSVKAGWVRICDLPECIQFSTLIRRVNQQLQTSGCFVSGVEDRAIHKIALSGGAFSEDWIKALAAEGVDCVISGEIKHHALLALEDLGIRGIAAGHDTTERAILPVLASHLELALPGLVCEVYSGLDYNQLLL